MSGRHWIVCASFDEFDDEWQVYWNESDAFDAYDNVIENGATIASVCAVIRSTDYEPHPAFAEVTP